MGMEFTSGLTEVNLKETGKKIRSLDMEFTTGKTAEFTRGIGNKIICMVKVFTNGQMEDNMKAST